jgi:hypothetical protein
VEITAELIKRLEKAGKIALGETERKRLNAAVELAELWEDEKRKQCPGEAAKHVPFDDDWYYLSGAYRYHKGRPRHEYEEGLIGFLWSLYRDAGGKGRPYWNDYTSSYEGPFLDMVDTLLQALGSPAQSRTALGKQILRILKEAKL